MLLGGSDNALNVISGQARLVAHWLQSSRRCRWQICKAGMMQAAMMEEVRQALAQIESSS
jgi:hypothetical protein